MNKITSNIKSIRDIMRKDTGVDGDAQRISQMVWMLFMKIFADKESNWKVLNQNYVSPIDEKFKWTAWAADTNGLTGEALMTFINMELFPAMKALTNPLAPDQAKIIRSVFEDTYNYMKNGVLFRQVINEINKIDFKNSSETHIFNDIYENILKELQSAGSSGEYYTPRAVTQFMVEMINPKSTDIILDPACGTGGFLTCSIDFIEKKNSTAIEPNEQQHRIRGVEKKPLPHLLCTTNLMLHGFDTPAIKRDNLLSKPLNDWESHDLVNIILSNPPFGGTEEDGTESNFPQEFRTKETADLFVILILKLLKADGRAAVILPDGFLFGEGVRTRIKEELLTKANLHTIVRLPNGVFSPYTNIKTNILFFEKGHATKEVWYYEHQYPKGQKNYNKTNPINIKEFTAEKDWWNNRIETDFAWKVSIKDIKKRNYNLDISSPYFGEDDEQLTISELMVRLEKSLDKSQKLLSSLKLEF